MYTTGGSKILFPPLLNMTRHNLNLKYPQIFTKLFSFWPEKEKLYNRYNVDRKCNTIIYSCLCGSHLATQQEGKGEIRYHFRQHSVCLQSYGNVVKSYFFKVYSNQVGLSGMFECLTLGLR